MNRWELEQKIIIKALKDPAFKKRLLTQPKEAVCEFLNNEKLADVFGFDKISIKVIEEKKDEWALAIPYVPPNTSNLSDAELEQLGAADAGQGVWNVIQTLPF